MIQPIPYIDLHQDIAGNSLYISNKDIFKRHNLHEGHNDLGLPVNNQVDLPRLKENGTRCIFAASFSSGLLSKEAERREHALTVLKQINFYQQIVKKAEKELTLIKNYDDYKRARQSGKIGLLLHLEGAEMLDDEGVFLETLYWLGVRSIGLTHNNKNQFAGGALSNGGLTKNGKKVLGKVSELGMIKDLAHLNKRSMNQALDIVEPPFMFSHGGIRSDKKVARNLEDQQALKIAEKGGVIGVSFAPSMLSSPDLETVAGVYEHLKELVGTEALAIGSDFDGITSKELVEDLDEISKMQNLAGALKERGFTNNQIEKIFYKNVENKLLKYLKG